MSVRSKRGKSTALLLVDFINPLDFPSAPPMRNAAIAAARRTAALRERLSRRGVPTIYANDHYGHWHESFPELVNRCLEPDCRGRPLVEALPPRKGDYVVLKPRHSAFFGTPLEFLLDELGTTRLIVTGLATDICVIISAEDAYMRRFDVWIPEDCVAANTPARTRGALRHAAEVLKADIRPSDAPATRKRTAGDDR